MRRVIVRRSSVHGKGVFAMRTLAAGERVLEYKGEVTSWRNAVRCHQREGVEGHTFLFGLSDGRVIDGNRGGNSARWLNHACEPNCETIEDEERIFIHTLRPIGAGEELFILCGYGISVASCMRNF
ncbi:SET domain-containing protein-lysine N-methyltransferase [Paraburkholderia sediminicola]|nr:SET domain-containing protein-lysine N-methyltransferase [Paraburkholderia sediminicola]